jgi:hypothetical protein
VTIAQLEGTHFRAISNAAAALLRLDDVSRAKRAVENYRIEASEDSQWYYVHFVPRLAVDEEPTLGGETSLGREVEFVLRKDSLAVVRHYFFE